MTQSAEELSRRAMELRLDAAEVLAKLVDVVTTGLVLPSASAADLRYRDQLYATELRLKSELYRLVVECARAEASVLRSLDGPEA